MSSSNSGSDSGEVKPVKRKEYDNVKKQTEVFKKLIKINEENRFNSFDINASKNIFKYIITNIFYNELSFFAKRL